MATATSNTSKNGGITFGIKLDIDKCIETKESSVQPRREITSEDLLIDPPSDKSSIRYVHFNLNASLPEEKSQLFGHARLAGKIPMMNPPEHYSLPPQEDLEYVVKWVQDFMLQNKLVRKGEKRKMGRIGEMTQDLAMLYAFAIPELKMKDEKTRLTVAMLVLIFTTDDIIEKSNLLGRNNEHACLVSEYITQIFSTTDVDEFEPESGMFPSLVPSARAGKTLAKRFLMLSPNFHSIKKPIADAVKRTYMGLLLLQTADSAPPEGHNCTELSSGQGKHPVMSEETFKLLRSADAATMATIEALLVLKDIQLDPEIRENLFFKRYLEIAERIVAFQNDLLGMEKDIENDEWNAILFKVKRYGIPLEDAFKQVLQEIEELMLDFEYLMNRLRKFFDDADLEDFLEVVIGVIDANGYLCLYTLRHGNLYKAFTSPRHQP